MRHAPRIPVKPYQTKAGVAQKAMTDELVRLFNQGDWPNLLNLAERMTQQYPKIELGWSAQGKALIQLNRASEALEPLRRASKLAPTESNNHSDLGLALSQLGQLDLAEHHYREAVRLQPLNPIWLIHLGDLLYSKGQLAQAYETLSKALQLSPNSTNAHTGIGNVLRAQRRFHEAIVHYQAAIHLSPNNLIAWMNIGGTHLDLQQIPEAEGAFRNALKLAPNFPLALRQLGRLLMLLPGCENEAVSLMERAVELTPQDPDAHIDLGNALLKTSPPERWQAEFKKAKQLRPLLTRQGSSPHSVLLIDTPLAGCTPLNHMLGDAPYSRHFYCLLPDDAPDAQALRQRAQVLINMVGDADNGSDILPHAVALADALDLPTINHPRAIMQTDRESIARLLQDTSGCVVPLTVRLDATEVLQAVSAQHLANLALPLIVRQAGHHGGDAMAKADNWTALADFVNEHGPGTYYVTQYIQYQSPDGQYRKYRFIFVDGRAYPYHLAIHDDWMVHHFRTDMKLQAWKRQEEADFLEDPARYFSAESLQTLKHLAQHCQLDYGGLDCGLTEDGRIVLFELNATMLVHDETDPVYLYKNPHVARIKSAFNDMLLHRAGLRAW